MILTTLLAVVAGAPLPVASATTGGGPAALERGRYLVAAGGCRSCHTADRPDAAAFAGGRALVTEFGTFYAPNITPDPGTGIGGWTVADVVRALREGRSPDGAPYFPAFPYPAYAGLSDADAAAIATWLLAQKPVRQATPDHELPWYLFSRWLVLGWNVFNFAPQAFSPTAGRPPEWNRGAYLVRHLGHCGECHTPRNLIGGLDSSRELGGNPAGPEGSTVPNITPDAAAGIGKWSADDLTTFLEIGMLPDGDFSGASMSEVIDDNTSQLTPADRSAIATYVLSLPPLPTAEPPATPGR